MIKPLYIGSSFPSTSVRIPSPAATQALKPEAPTPDSSIRKEPFDLARGAPLMCAALHTAMNVLRPPKKPLIVGLMVKRVLIADDNIYVRYVIGTFLQDQVEIEICGETADGVHAIEKTRELNPDLILLDLAMPSLNGAEVALVLKNTRPDVPIILFTMYSSKISPSLISTLGIDTVLSKPDGMMNLIKSINTVCAP